MSRPRQAQSHHLISKGKGRAGVEPATYRAATNCSTTELTPQPTAQPASSSHLVAGTRVGEQLRSTKKSVEEQGIDPCASCMQSRRSTI